MYQNASTQRRGFPQIRTLNWVLHHFMFTWPPDKSPFLSWKTLHFNTENCANGFYIASQLLIHFIFPTWQGWLQVVKLCNHLFFLHACGWAPLLSNFWDEKHACEPKGRRENDSWCEHRKCGFASHTSWGVIWNHPLGINKGMNWNEFAPSSDQSTTM